METIHIYHTNDLHSHFEHWPRIHRRLADRKQWHTAEGDAVYLFDVGDHMDRWHPFSEGTMGKGNTELLNDAGYTAVTIGNNEGITLPHGNLDTMYENAKFDVLAANIFKMDGSRPQWAKPFSIYSTSEGTRIGVIGLTVYFAHFYEMLDWELTEPVNQLKKELTFLKENSDVIILLSHLGLPTDERIAAEFPAIDVILGAHTHHILHGGKIIKNTLLGAAGKYGQFVGHVTLQVDEKHKVTGKSAILYDVNGMAEHEGDRDEEQALIQHGKQLLAEKVVSLPASLSSEYFIESALPSLLCEAIREWCDADCAFINAGLLLGPLTGNVTKFDLLRICPHPINPCAIELTGTELKEILIQTTDATWPHMQIKGLGFRGNVMGMIVYDRIAFEHGNSIIRINGKVIQPEKKYRLAIPDMFTFGKFFSEAFRAKKKQYYLPEFLRNVLEWKLTR
ncbi:MAG: bifunctional UDP-sugar hydrolase/5'-nucleotidase [Bacillota bacterium]|nr:bifunctional UDP-sugar hydrolase/5'-nucleotidase [Bacillota bacterium]